MTPIDEILATLDDRQRAELEKIRRIVHEIVPGAEEGISYGMPAFKYNGKYLVGFSAFKDHLSLFPTAGPIQALKHRLGDFTLSKGTIRFTLERPIPEPIIKEILLCRLADIDKD